MSLLALGLNHHTAPVDIRERAAIGDEHLSDALLALRDVDAVNEAAIVSTCNRTEIYCGMNENDAAPVVDWMHHYLWQANQQLDPYLFRHANQDAVRHLMRVCSGLDSMVLGEPQILGQMKQAFRNASEAGTVGAELSPLFQSAFSVAKQVRTDTAIGNSPVSVAFAAVSLARQIFADFSRHHALLIGAGDTIQLTARHLQSAGIGNITIANRSEQRARMLADEVNGQSIGLSDIPKALVDADIVISSTGSPLPIVGKGMAGSALKARKFRTQLMVDIAVPRDIEAEVADLDGIFLYTVDDLTDVIEENRQSRSAAAVEAEEIVNSQVEDFMRRIQALGANDLIRAYRTRVTGIQEDALARGLKQMQAGRDPEAVLRNLAHTLSNKLMHTPTTRLREAAEIDDQALLKAARTLLDLPELPDNKKQ